MDAGASQSESSERYIGNKTLPEDWAATQ